MAQELPGVVVEEVRAGFAAEKAGIEPGDLLLSWQRSASPPANPESARGDFLSPFDLLAVELEQAPRGQLRVSARRAGELFAADMPPGEWRLSARPRLAKGELQSYLEGTKRLALGAVEDAIGLWRETAQRLRQAGEPASGSADPPRPSTSSNGRGPGASWSFSSSAI